MCRRATVVDNESAKLIWQSSGYNSMLLKLITFAEIFSGKTISIKVLVKIPGEF